MKVEKNAKLYKRIKASFWKYFKKVKKVLKNKVFVIFILYFI